VIAGASTFEALAGAGAVFLGVLILIGVLPVILTAIATITIGAGLFVLGTGMASQYARLVDDETGGQQVESVGGMGVHVLGGAGGIALGILALVGIAPRTLIAVALIVLGATMALGAGAVWRLRDLRLHRARGSLGPRVATEATAGAEVLLGLSSAVLGTLVGVAVLALGGTLLLGGSAIGAVLVARSRQQPWPV
jgi:hypothetical protein